MKTLIVGKDPTRIEHLWQMMYRQHFWHSNGIVRATALAGIDLALWDILGKLTSLACHKLWGGAVRDRVRLYCHLGGGRMEDFYETAVDEAKRFADLTPRRSLVSARSGDRDVACRAGIHAVAERRVHGFRARVPRNSAAGWRNAGLAGLRHQPPRSSPVPAAASALPSRSLWPGEGADLIITARTRADLASARASIFSSTTRGGSSATPKPVVAFDDAFWDLTLRINLTAPYQLCKKALPGMVARRFGRVIAMASINAIRGG